MTPTPPVLLLVFNRPDSTRRVAEAVETARPDRLYVAADGPRKTHPQDEAKCAEARRVATDIPTSSPVRTLFRDKNIGVRHAVSTAIDWFFQHEDEGIILEDDCLPDASFFRYSAQLLDRYRANPRVMVISGNHFHGDWHEPPYSYFFSRYPHIWGWATWRTAWLRYDDDMSAWPRLRETDWLLSVGDDHRDFVRYWRTVLDDTYANLIDSWAYRWTFSCWIEGGLTVLPSRNLVKNIGFGADATHTRSKDHWRGQLELETLATPLRHPPSIHRDIEADRWTDLNVFGTKNSLFKRILGPPARYLRSIFRSQIR